MSNNMDKGGTSSIPMSSDNNQPMDLAQKPHNLKIPDTGGGVKNATVVHFGGALPKLSPGSASHTMPGKVGLRMETSSGYSLVAKPPQNSPTSALNLTSSSNMLKSVTHATPLTITSPTVSGPPPTAHSGYHIPRGPAYVASIAAPRPQNIASIVRTTPQPIPTVMTSTSMRSNSGQRVIPISTTGNTWNRMTSSVMTKVPNPSARATPRSQATIGNVTNYSTTLKPAVQSIQKGQLRCTVTDSIKMQVPKGGTSTYPLMTPKYVTSSSLTSNRMVQSANVATAENIYTPSSSLVTSLASSGTTITPHAVSRPSASSFAVRITAGNSQGDNPSKIIGPPTTGSNVTVHPSLGRNSSIEHHIPIKTPIVRAPLSTNVHHSKTSLASGQISFGTSKVIPQNMCPTLSVSQISTTKASVTTSMSPVMPYQITGSTTLINRANSTNHPRVFATTPALTGLSKLAAASIAASDFSQKQRPTPVLSKCRNDKQYMGSPYFFEQTSPAQNTVTITQNLGHRASPSCVNKPVQHNIDGQPVTNIIPAASPRPSILRKRPENESVPSKVSKNLNTSFSGSIGSPGSPKRPDSRGNSSGSTISALSADNEDDRNAKDTSSSEDSQTAFPMKSTLSVHGENGLSTKNHIPLNIPQLNDGVSPRKKPRKQQLMGNELQEARCTEEAFQKVSKKLKMVDSYDGNGHQTLDENSPVKIESPDRSAKVPARPHMSLLRTCKKGWKSRHNHFNSPSDIKLKEEKKKTINDIANQKLIVQRANGWKVIHLMGQVEELVDIEDEVMAKLNTMLSRWEGCNGKVQQEASKELEGICELYRANIQRSKTIKQQMVDSKVSVDKIFNHKSNIVEILSKFSNKRNIKRRERT